MSDPKDSDKKENTIGDGDANEKLEPEIIENGDEKPAVEELPSSPVSDSEKSQDKPAFLPTSLSPSRLIYALAVFLFLIFALFMLWPRGEKADKDIEASSSEDIQFAEEEITPEERSAKITPAENTTQSNQIVGADIEISNKTNTGLTQTTDRTNPPAITARDIVEQPAIIAPAISDNETADTERLQLQQEAKLRAEERLRQRQKEREARIAAATSITSETITDDQSQSAAPSKVIIKDAISPSTSSKITAAPEQSADDKINNSIVDDINIDALRAQLRAEILAEAEAERLQEQQRLREAQKKIAELETKLHKIENSAQQQASRAVALSLALDRLEDKVSSGEPYEEELQVFKQLAPSTYDTTTLEALAASGVTDLHSLQQDYAGFAREALSEIRRDQAKGFLGGLNASLSNMFSLRRIGDVSGDTPSAIIARAEMRLGEGDLETALNELRKLPAPAKEAMAIWRVRAEEHLSAEQNIDRLKNRLLRDVQ